MRAKSDGVCQDCKTRVVLNRYTHKGICFNCHSVNVIQRKCALCLQPINVGDDCSWDRRGNKWEAHTQCWLNSSPEARERVIRRQEEENKNISKVTESDNWKWKGPKMEKVDIEKEVEKPSDSDLEGLVESFDAKRVKVVEDNKSESESESETESDDEEDNFTTIEKPKTIKTCISFYDSVYLLIAARIHFYIYGPAGCGKSHIVEQASHYFSLSFSSLSLNVQTMPSTLLGYKDINGVYQSTDFRKIFEFGGVFLIDEMDNASGNLLTTLNSALANRFLQFPDGMITMHPDCIVVATGNTTGRGKTAQYISRQTLDAATLDRFAYLAHDYDESLELALAMGATVEEKTTGTVEFVPCVDASKRTCWARIIQQMRANGKKHGLQVVVSLRPTITGCKLLNHFAHSTLLEMLVLKGVDKDTKAKLMEGVYV